MKSSNDRIGVARRATLRVCALVFVGTVGLYGLAQAQSAGTTPSTPVTAAPSSQAPAPATPPAPAAQNTKALPAEPAAAPTTTIVQTTTVTKTKGEAAAVHTDLPSDLSVEGMFKAADPIVQAVMGLLAAASVATWSIFLYKLIELSVARSRARSDLRTIAEARSLQQASMRLKKGPVAKLALSAKLEMEESENLPAEGIKERVAIALQRVESAAARGVGTGTGILASVGSTGPFVGLFGTVWGIMNSFVHISNSHTTNLSVVAPGIAEALLATAMGLVAAIPAVVIYNMFSRWITAYRLLLGDASAGIMRHVSRDLDRSRSGSYTRVAAE